MFLEGKIAGRMFGDPARDFHAIQGLSELQDCVSTIFVSNTSEQRICNVIHLTASRSIGENSRTGETCA